MKLITHDMALSSVLLVGKFIGRIKRGAYYVALLSHFNDGELKEMSIFDVSRFEAQYTIIVTLVLIVFGRIHH